ncbi:hypothetical protein BT96DRAFT_887634 [Gymnopus androsaceus JB14]|uniref:phytol kinase n=1 Tax=Gymnopus androsaceus JB14 TaxID=1447944 RepID=A0A6A4H6I8_9AGAR|nr:hypothetical protein BT96DRAFT_887634 [Gymnopus androsaceus JB14]
MMPASAAITYFKSAEALGRSHLQNDIAPDCFDDNASYGAPNFWGIPGTRPYMRLLRNMTQLYIQMHEWDLAVKQNIEILRLCESDNMGQRAWMAPLLLHVGRPADALYFCQQWLSDWSSSDELPKGIKFKAPFKKPLTKAEIERMSKYVDLQMIHSATLSAFMLYGDVELSRQYLHIAVQYPHVLIKVIGKFKERMNGDTHPVRLHNGVEDARDHLWLAQDLWSKDDVWNWVKSDAVVTAAVLRPCSDPTCRRLEEQAAQWQKCSGCKEEWYCSRACQKSHWPSHKEICKRKQEEYRDRQRV